MSVRTSPSKRSRSKATPVSAIFSLTRTFKGSSARPRSSDGSGLRRAGAGKHFLRTGHAGAERDGGAQLVQRHLEAGDGGHAVQRAVVAAGRDPEDPPLQA